MLERGAGHMVCSGPAGLVAALLPADPDSRVISATARRAMRFPWPLFVGGDACSAPGFMRRT